jgi:hypothetical protein
MGHIIIVRSLLKVEKVEKVKVTNIINIKK